MTNPPIPIIPSLWLSAMTGLVWAYVRLAPDGVTSLGQLFDGAGSPHYVAAVAGSGLGSCQWAAGTTAPSNGVAAVLMTSGTATILTSGTVNANGSMSYSGVTYYIKWTFDGANVRAEAHAA